MTENVGKRRGLVLLALTTACALAAILVAERFHLRLDLSADRSQSLSKAARELKDAIPETLRLTYYLSPQLDDRDPGPRAIRDFLRELEAASAGRVVVEVLDPAKSGGAADSLGLQPRQMQVVEGNERRVALVYSGLVLEYLGRVDSIPFALDAAGLEYELVKAVRALVSARSPKAAVLVGDPDKSFATDYRALAEALAQSRWEVAELSPGDPVPPDTAVLLVLGNAAIDDYAAYRVDEYLAGGGAAFLAVKGVDVEAREALRAFPLREDAIIRALAAWGAKVRPSLVLDRSSLTVPFQEAAPGGGMTLRYVRYPHWVVVRPENAEASNPVTARLRGLDLYWPSPIDLEPPPGVEAKALASTTSRAWLMTRDFAVAAEEEARFALESETSTGRYTLAATLAGRLPRAYPAGSALPAREGAPPLGRAEGEVRPSRIFLVSSADFANDLMSMTDSLFNAAFIAAAVDWLASGDELAAIRARGSRDPRLSRIVEAEGRRAAILFSYFVNLALVPGAVLVLGLLRARKRRRRAAAAPESPVPETAVPDSPEGRSP